MRDEDLHAFVAETRAVQASGRRRRQRWLERQLDEDDTLGAACARLADRGADVEIATTGGGRFRGRLVAASPTLVALATPAAAATYVAAAAVDGVRVLDGVGGEHAPLRLPLPAEGGVPDVLDAAIVGRTRVTLGTTGGRRVSGIVDSVGRDVVRLADPAVCYVPLAAITDVTVERCDG